MIVHAKMMVIGFTKLILEERAAEIVAWSEGHLECKAEARMRLLKWKL